MPFLVFALLLALAVASWWSWRHLRRRRRETLRQRPLSAQQLAILDRNLRCHRYLPPALRRQLHGLVQVFLDGKTFHGCDGFSIDEEVRVTIAGHACLLLLNRATDCYAGFSSILVYPGAFRVREQAFDGPIAGLAEDTRAGESWHRGPVVLAWDQILESIAHRGAESYNVIIHEFAHKLDEENIDADGLPLLADREEYRRWAQVFRRAYSRLQESGGGDEVLDDYAASSPAEFFAVASETFFEQAGQLRRIHPELYRALAHYYRVDPAQWRAPDTAARA